MSAMGRDGMEVWSAACDTLNPRRACPVPGIDSVSSTLWTVLTAADELAYLHNPIWWAGMITSEFYNGSMSGANLQWWSVKVSNCGALWSAGDAAACMCSETVVCVSC